MYNQCVTCGSGGQTRARDSSYFMAVNVLHQDLAGIPALLLEGRGFSMGWPLSPAFPPAILLISVPGLWGA